MNRGFTVVEILVTLVVIGIIMGLGTVGLRSSLANARDSERQADIEIIARGLEQHYNNGNPYYIAGVSKGTYPGSNQLISIDGSGWCNTAYFKSTNEDAKYSKCVAPGGYWEVALPGVTQSALTPPGKISREVRNPWLVSPENIPAWITAELNAGKYTYVPTHEDGGHCYEACPSFELSYKKETTGDVVVVKSRHK